jgi:hypothetical protein
MRRDADFDLPGLPSSQKQNIVLAIPHLPSQLLGVVDHASESEYSHGFVN